MTDYPSPDRMFVAAGRVEPGNRRSHPMLERKLVFALIWLLPCAYYLALLTDGRFNVLQPITLGMAFNDMLAHLLQGRFDVDPAVIGTEGFVHDGRTYSYFGIFCALLRLPLVPFSALRSTDITIASTFVAVCVAWLFRLMALRTVLSRVPSEAASPLLVIILVLAFALQGEGVQFLRPLIYQEVAFWSDAIASAFVFLTVELVTRVGPSLRLVSPGFAAVAGLALLTRVSTGLGLYAAMAFMLLVELVRIGSPRLPDWWRRLAGFTVSRGFVSIVTILAFFVVCTGLVNYGRWGNPLTFVDLHTSKTSLTESLDRIPRLDRYGEFNLVRLPFGLVYYFLPLWVVLDQNGGLLFHDIQRNLFDAVELPPGTFLLSDPLLVVLGVVFAVRAMQAWRAAVVDLPLACAALIGLAVPAMLMLIAISLNFRYRTEFYPLFDTAALLGLFVLLKSGTPIGRGWLTPVVAAISIIGVITAHVTLLLYKVSPGGPAVELDFSHGWTGIFARSFADYYPKFAPLVAGWLH